MAYNVRRNQKTGYVALYNISRIKGSNKQRVEYIVGFGVMSKTEFAQFKKYAHSIHPQEKRLRILLSNSRCANNELQIPKKNKYKISKMTSFEISDHIDKVCKGDVYARNVWIDSKEGFSEEGFMNSKSYDEFVVEDVHSLEDAQKLINEYGLDGEPINLKAEGKDTIGSGYGVRYNGVNALQSYDRNMMPHEYPNGHVVIFEGKNKGENLLQDGDVVEPKKILEVIQILPKGGN